MKKLQKYLTAVCLCIVTSIASAQYITIPDTNFVKYLDSIVPTAMNGNLMDTTSPVLQTITRIDVENMGIDSLYGIQYFTSLVTLDCGNGSPSIDSNRITALFTLPPTLDSLICGNNQIRRLPNRLPKNLTVLKCYTNRLTSLPAIPPQLIYFDCSNNQLGSLAALPATLTTLYCEVNRILNLPTLPASLSDLNCSGNLLTNLPTLPASLAIFDCEGNQITNLPALPASLINLSVGSNPLSSGIPTLPANLQSLSCYNNTLTGLPALPATLTFLACGDNQLDSLQALLPPSLSYLDCSNNQLSSLPSLPATLTGLVCSGNKLTDLPVLPGSLTQLFCGSNNISCFPVFPNTLTDTLYFNIIGNPFQCLPNYVHAMLPGTLAYPLCMPGNPNGCPPANGVVGFTYNDMNGNCRKDSGDKGIQNIAVQLFNAGNSLIGQTYTAENGVYDFSVGSGSYNAQIDTAGLPCMVQCAHPGTDSLLTVSTIDTNVNFSFACKPGFDVGVQSVVTKGLVFPGMTHTLSIVAGDMSQWFGLSCAAGMSGTVQITINGPVTYVGPGQGALSPVNIGNVFTYTIPDFGLINNKTAFNLLLNTNKTAKAGDTICVYIAVTPSTDNNTSNNKYQYCYNVVNSHDPNIKEVYPVDVPPLYSDWFTYTIHFQNTGSAPAHNILLTDTLDSQLDLSTFQVINYSNKNTVMLNGNLLSVQFPNINLPDSAINPDSSIGFVQYRVKPISGLPNGTIIKNTGYIYFDYNAPVITNTTHNIFGTPAGINNITDQVSCKVFPNPNNGSFTIQLKNESPTGSNKEIQVVIYNMLGENIYSKQASTSEAQLPISICGKPAGVYFYRVLTNNGTLLAEGKIVIE